MARQRGASGDGAGGESQPRKGGGSRLWWFGSRLAVFVVLLLVLVFFAPLMVTTSGLGHVTSVAAWEAERPRMEIAGALSAPTNSSRAPE